MVLVGYNSFYETFAGLYRHFLASQDLTVDMIFEWLEFLGEVETEKNRKIPKNRKKKNRKLPQISNLGLIFFGFFRVFFRFFGLQPAPLILDFELINV